MLAALAAGFIGQFGRSLALHILSRRHKKSKQEINNYDHNIEIERQNSKRLKTIGKMEKKRLKSEQKISKKEQD